MCQPDLLQPANADHRYDKLIAAADKFVRGLQVDGADGRDKSNIEFGGVGYGNATRPDLSNTAFLVDALHAAGTPGDDEALQKALVFISRCQNLETEHNTTEFAAKNPDGGFYYTPAVGGQNPAERTPTGGLRSYGSMTYAGLKSMIFAGLSPDDPHVRPPIAGSRRTTIWTAIPAWAPPACTTITTCSPSRSKRSAPTTSPMPRASSTIGVRT